MKDNEFDINLKKVIGQLPEYDHKASVWNKIEAKLEFDNKLEREIAKLPELEFKKDVWINIEKSLDHIKIFVPKTKLKKLIIYSLSAAAVIVSLIGFSIFLNNSNNTKITYSQEDAAFTEKIESTETTEPDPIKFLEENCANVPEVCSRPEFLEQKKQLIELNTEYKNIKEVIKMYGESPELVKSLIKIENLKSEILKDLIKTLNS